MLAIVFIAENAGAGESLEGRRLQNLCQVIKAGAGRQQRGSSAAMKVRRVKMPGSGIRVGIIGIVSGFNVKLIKEYLADAWSLFFFFEGV